MSDIEYDQAMLIEAIIDKKMRPIYWIVGGSMLAMLTIFVTIALPIQNKLMDVAVIQKGKMDKSEAEETYMGKWQYYQIEEDEHRVLREVLKTPDQVDYLMGVINDNIKKELGFKYTSRGQLPTN